MSNKVVTAKQAVEAVADGSTVVVCGCENILLPEKVLTALEQRFFETGHPNNLCEMHPIIYGMGPGLGLEHFAHEGMVTRSVGSGFSFLKTSQMTRMIQENKVEAYVMPMGSLYAMFTGVASGERHTLSRVGFGTFVDPGVEGGCMNSVTPNTYCSRVSFEGEEYIKYDNPKIDVAIIRGTTADEFGNLSLEEEPVNLGIRTMAMAAKACGGKVIAQVKRLARRGSIPPRSVEVPGLMVDMVVVDGEQRTSGGDDMNPALTGEIRVPVSALDPLPLDAVKVISRRAAREITAADAVVNLGVGIPVNIPMIQVEEGGADTIFFPEHGSIGGVPGGRAIFGTNINPEAIIDSTNVFHYYRGGGLTQSFLGFGQIDQHGNVNVSKFGNVMPGCGGFIDIAHRTGKLVFCGTFTAGGADLAVQDGKLDIRQEGKHRKLVPQVEQITLNGQEALRKGQEVLYVTERAVFRLTDKGLQLEEIAPGVDLQRDILDLIPFPVLAGNPKEMDESLFRE